MWMLLAALVTLGVVGTFLKVLSSASHPTAIYGKLTPKDIAAIKGCARQEIFQRGLGGNLRWIPASARKYIPVVFQRPISDMSHPIDIILVKSDGVVEVWFRGPEEKAYVNGRQHGWFSRSMGVWKDRKGWTTGRAPVSMPAMIPGAPMVPAPSRVLALPYSVLTNSFPTDARIQLP
jgi:hypothetical protein